MSKMKSNLQTAKRAKQDDFFTQIDCVKNELDHYTDYFTGKKIYLNCDSDKSKIFQYFKDNFNTYHLTSLTATCYNNSGNGTKYEVTDGKTTSTTQLKGNGSYNSTECLEELQSCDVVITNPPFSLFRDYITTVNQSQKDFVVLGTLNALTYKNVFKMLMDDKIRMGYGKQNQCYNFAIPDYYEVRTKNYTVQGDEILLPVQNCCWYTNIDLACNHGKQFEFSANSPKYEESKYCKYMNYDAINCDAVKQIPCDYYGVMGVPLTYACVHNPKLFEIVGSNQYNIDDLSTYSLYFYNEKNQIIHTNKLGNSIFLPVDGKETKKKTYWDDEGNLYIAPYARIFIKRISQTVQSI